MSETAPLLVEKDQGVLTLTNNDAPINRMSFEYMDALEEAASRTVASGPHAGTRLRIGLKK